MNVLNGLAVHDTGKMINDSMIESQISVINMIQDYESFYLRTAEIFSYLGINAVCAKKMSIFQSPYLEDGKLTIPLKVEESNWTRYINFCSRHYTNKYSVERDLGQEGFLVKTRKIVRELRIQKQEEKDQASLVKEQAALIKEMNRKLDDLQKDMKDLKTS